jgi:hypothetical protein
MASTAEANAAINPRAPIEMQYFDHRLMRSTLAIARFVAASPTR